MPKHNISSTHTEKKKVVTYGIGTRQEIKNQSNKIKDFGLMNTIWKSY